VRGAVLVVLWPSAHHDRQDIAGQRVHEELLRDVVLAVGVLERQVEFVITV
jgi:hypothetical protein